MHNDFGLPLSSFQLLALICSHYTFLLKFRYIQPKHLYSKNSLFPPINSLKIHFISSLGHFKITCQFGRLSNLLDRQYQPKSAFKFLIEENSVC